MATPAVQLLSLVVLASYFTGILAHGGGLHDWVFNPSSSANGTRPLRSFITYQVATCNSFAPISASTALGPLPFMPSLSSANSSLSAQGTVRIWYYQSNNCSDSPNSAFEVDVYVTQPDGTSYAGKPVYGYGFTGPCSTPGDIYKHNLTLGDDRFNMHWWNKENAVTEADGALWGGAPNSWYSRLPNTTMGTVIQSLVLFPSPADSYPLCCNFQYTAPPPTAWYTEGRVCRPRPPSPPSPSPPTPKVAIKRRPPPSPKRRPAPKKRSPPPKASSRKLL